MKLGKTINETAQLITQNHGSKRDYLADTQNISVELDDGGRPEIHVNGSGYDGGFLPTSHCSMQLAGYLGIPRKYAEKMRVESPDLYRTNYNHWLRNTKPERRMVRTLHEEARAFLSSSYRILDDVDVVRNVMPKLIDAGYQIKASEVTEHRLYIQAITPKIEAEIKVGDVVQAGVVISNSEVGMGSLKIETMLYRLFCKNGCITPDSITKRHLGKSRGDFEGDLGQYSNKTLRLSDAAFWSSVNDTLDAVCSKNSFEMLVDKQREASERKLTNGPKKTIEITQKRYNLNETEGDKVLQYLIEGGDLTQYGLCQAVTQHAHDVSSFERNIELQRIGGKIINLSDRDALIS